MAASGSTVGGYDCELFLNPVPEDLKCGLCKQVAREPNQTGCCGDHYCKLCIEQTIQGKKSCPSCEEVEFPLYPDKRDHRKILALEVHCALRDRGCDWTGTLEQLNAHLDMNSDNCQYVDIKCPNKCNQPIQKHHLPTHLANECTKRDFFCQYCNFTATYEVVCNDHWPQCPFYPVPCPNGCEIMAIERDDLDAHLMLCSLEVVECDFNYAGCNVKVVREEMEKHLADNLERHMLMMNKALQEKIEKKERKIEQLEARLEEKDRQIKEVQEEKDQQIREQVRERERQIKEVREEKDREVRERERQIQELREENDRKIQELRKTVKEEQEKQTQETQAKVAEVEAQLVAQRERQIQELQKRVKEEQGKQIQETRARLAQVEAQLVAHVQEYRNRFGIAQFTMNGVQEMMGRNGHWLSPPLYTHPGGYKIGIRACPSGYPAIPSYGGSYFGGYGGAYGGPYGGPHGGPYGGSYGGGYGGGLHSFPGVVLPKHMHEGRASGGYGASHEGGCVTHITVSLCSAIGDNDAQLNWSADCTITLQLLNQHRDQDHITVSQQFQWDKPTSTALSVLADFNTFKNKGLNWNAEKQTQYLKNNSLQFRISDIRVHNIEPIQ